MPTAPSGTDQPRFGEVLRRLRAERRLTQEMLAERAGLSVRGISDLERGARGHPQRETIRLLADALALTADERARLADAARRPIRPALSHPQRRTRGAAWATRFPALADPLVGRQAELAQIEAVLRSGPERLVALTGPPGVGKTRLAMEFAAAEGEELANEVTFVPLAAVRDPALVAGEIARVLGVRDAAELPLLPTLIAALGTRPHLLVLDNFEHLLPASTVVSDLLASCPELLILLTSRTPLRIAGERQLRVPPLEVPEELPAIKDEAGAPSSTLDWLADCPAVALFLQRGQRTHGGFALTEGNAHAVVAICRRLEGLPLAIELAAARLSVLSPQGLLARLEPRLPLLRAGAADRSDRLRTMEGAIAWSYHLLTPEEQRVLRQLAVFVGGFTLEAASAVADPEPDRATDPELASPPEPSLELIDAVSELTAKSLLHRVDHDGEEPRFGMLETIREFGLEQLRANGEADAAERRHAAFFLGLGEGLGPQLIGPRSLESFDRLSAELPNLRAAMAWAVENDAFASLLRALSAMFPFWWVRANPGEGRRWLERGLVRSHDVPPRTRADALQLASALASLQADHDPAMRLAEESLALSRAKGYPLGVATALLRIGQSAEWQGDHALATRCYEDALPISRELDDPYWEALFLSNLGDAFLWQDDPDRAAPFAEDGLERWRELGNEWGIALALGTSAAVAAALGDRERAHRLYEESLDLWIALGDRRGIAGAMAGIAAMAAAQSQLVSAARLLGAARALGDAAGTVYLAHHIGYERTLAAVKAQLDEGAFVAAWDAGRSLPVSQAIAEAGAFAGIEPSEH